VLRHPASGALCTFRSSELVDGLRPELLAMADAHVRIPMLGQKKSLNVATAGGMVLYELLRKYRVLRSSPEFKMDGP
jgi:tRNA C32,U32 (ribose-2'-O)-methylase TrmJ